jgi:hypothetical protein
MLSKYQACILTSLRQNDSASEAGRLGPGAVPAALGPALVAVAILAISFWPKAAEPEPRIHETMVGREQPRPALDAGVSTPGARSSEPETSAEFRFGFLEFEREPDKPDAMPGFASWSPESRSATALRVPDTSQ